MELLDVYHGIFGYLWKFVKMVDPQEQSWMVSWKNHQWMMTGGTP